MESFRLSDWQNLLNELPKRNILVLGDIILDSYLHGDVTRISPEAPVPVLEVNHEEYRLGGAANVAVNIRSLGATTELVGVVGEDSAAGQVEKLLGHLGIHADGVVSDPTRPTSLKTRVIARTQQIVRLDRESRAPIHSDLRREVLEKASERLAAADAVVIADYDKGLLDERMILEIRDLARERGIPTLVDPKMENFWHYKRVTCVTPNTNEAGTGAGRKIHSVDDLRYVGRRLLGELELDYLLITRGPEGMSLFEFPVSSSEFPVKDQSELGTRNSKLVITHIPTVAREVYDVTGAGDTVVALFTIALAAGATPLIAARLANYAAGIVVGQMGCASVTCSELWTVLEERAEGDLRNLQEERLDF